MFWFLNPSLSLNNCNIGQQSWLSLGLLWGLNELNSKDWVSRVPRRGCFLVQGDQSLQSPVRVPYYRTLQLSMRTVSCLRGHLLPVESSWLWGISQRCHWVFFVSIPNIIILQSNSYILIYSKVSSFCVVSLCFSIGFSIEIFLKEITSKWGIRCSTCARVR